MTGLLMVCDSASNGLQVWGRDQSVTLSSAANPRCSGGESNQ